MNRDREALALSLRRRFGTAPEEPTEDQLENIIRDVRRIDRPTEEDWRYAVHQRCPSAGTHKYAAVDNSDLNELLAQASQGSTKQKTP